MNPPPGAPPTRSGGGVGAPLPPLRIAHIPRFRSTRPVWLYYELKELYGSDESLLPRLELWTFPDVAEFRKSKPQWLLDINPNGKVPSMQHGPIHMWEGGAICSFLLDQYDVDRRLLPRGSASAISTYYLLVSWCASTLDNLTATSSPLQLVLPPTCTAKPQDDVETNSRYHRDVFAPWLCERLREGGGPFLCGGAFTAADVVIGYNLLSMREKMAPPWFDAESYPIIEEYFQLLRARPAFLKAIGTVDDQDVVPQGCNSVSAKTGVGAVVGGIDGGKDDAEK